MAHSIDTVRALRRMLRADMGEERSFILISFDHDHVQLAEPVLRDEDSAIMPYSITFAGLSDKAGHALLRGVAEHAPGAESGPHDYEIEDPFKDH